MSFREFWRRHPGFVTAFAIILVAALALDAWLIHKRVTYQREIARLRAGMSEAERRRTDAILASEERRLEMMMELLRRQAKWDKTIHLAVEVDSGKMYLEREGATLREVDIEIGPERRIGLPPDTVHMAVPRGARSVVKVLGEDDPWEIPRWIYVDRGLPIPADRVVKGALGPVAILLEGGTVIYSLPSVGPINDSSYVLPGAVRASAEDLRAIAPNLEPGSSVYFY